MPPTTYHLRNESGIEVFTGTIVPAPGGGSQPLKFPVAFDDANLSDGIVVWTPTVDMWLRDAWLYFTTAWGGTTPIADIGVIADGKGLFTAAGGATANGCDATAAWGALGYAPSFVGATASPAALSVATDPYNGNNQLPYFVAAGTPFAVWVSEDGTPGGTDPGAAHGQAVLVIDAVPA